MALVHPGVGLPLETGVSGLRTRPELGEAPAGLPEARAAIEAVRVGGPAHEGNRREILEFLDAHPDSLHRSCQEGHLTGSAVVVDPGSGRVLLLLHAKVGRWLQPGGHADGDGDLARVALREAEEETGIVGLRVLTPAVDLDVHVFRARAADEPDHLHLDVRHLVIAPPGATAVINHESDGARWVDEEDLASLGVDDGTVRMVRAARVALAALDARAP